MTKELHMLLFRNFLAMMAMMLTITSISLNAQELLAIFAANLETTGGVNGSDNSGADLYSVRFSPKTKTVADLKRLTATNTEIEFFPSLSPDRKWVAYNYQRGGRNEIRLLNLETNAQTNIFTGGRFPEWVNANELLATYVSRDTQDVFLLKLDLSGAIPKISSRRQMTARTRCQGTSIVDFSTAVEKLAGKTGRDFSTASARLISSTPPATGVVYVTLAMHNEDNFPPNQQVYLTSRNNLIEFGKMLQRHNVPFNWESDWRFLNGVLQWDTPAVTASTNGKNIVRYLKEDLGISIDPHSHENNGYNYADVAHLIDSLGVQPTHVVGGHIWDPNERLYQNWERFKQPLKGNRFPWSQWKGDILMGSATGLHRNDPEPSGVWRPKGKYDFWSDDPASTVHGIGQHQGSVAGIQDLVNLYKTGAVTPEKILTATIVSGQALLNAPYISNYETTTLKPLLEMQDRGEIKIVTFGQLLDEWKAKYNSVPHVRLGPATGVNENTSGVSSPMAFILAQNYPNPFNPVTTIRFALARRKHAALKVLDTLGREVATLIDGELESGEHTVVFDASKLASGTYYYYLRTASATLSKTMQLLK
jgi:hypothetical protein